MDNYPIKSVFSLDISNWKETLQNLMAERGYDSLDSPYGFYARSMKLESFLNACFNVESDINDIMNFIIVNKLWGIIHSMPKLVWDYFNTNILSLKLDDDAEELLIIEVCVDMDGLLASNKLTQFEDYCIEKFGELFLKYILIDVEFQ